MNLVILWCSSSTMRLTFLVWIFGYCNWKTGNFKYNAQSKSRWLFSLFSDWTIITNGQIHNYLVCDVHGEFRVFQLGVIYSVHNALIKTLQCFKKMFASRRDFSDSHKFCYNKISDLVRLRLEKVFYSIYYLILYQHGHDTWCSSALLNFSNEYILMEVGQHNSLLI